MLKQAVAVSIQTTCGCSVFFAHFISVTVSLQLRAITIHRVHPIARVPLGRPAYCQSVHALPVTFRLRKHTCILVDGNKLQQRASSSRYSETETRQEKAMKALAAVLLLMALAAVIVAEDWQWVSECIKECVPRRTRYITDCCLRLGYDVGACGQGAAWCSY